MQHVEFANGCAPRPTHDVLPGTAQLWPLLLHLLSGFINRIAPFFIYIFLMHVEGAGTFTETPTCMRACESVCVHACVCVCAFMLYALNFDKYVLVTL